MCSSDLKSPVSLLASAESPLSGESFLFGLSSSLPFKLMRTPLVGWILGALKVAVPGPFRLIEDPADEPAPLSTDTFLFIWIFFEERHGTAKKYTVRHCCPILKCVNKAITQRN